MLSSECISILMIDTKNQFMASLNLDIVIDLNIDKLSLQFQSPLIVTL